MGAFNTKTELQGNPALIPAIADRICRDFAADGYEVTREDLISGGVDISVTKGGHVQGCTRYAHRTESDAYTAEPIHII